MLNYEPLTVISADFEKPLVLIIGQTLSGLFAQWVILLNRLLSKAPPPSAFVVLPFFLPFYEKPLKTVGISIFYMIYHIVKRGVDCGIS